MTERILVLVCTGNYYRSRYAELLFNALAPADLGWRADSRGFALSPYNDGPIAPVVLERLRAANLLPPHPLRNPQTLARADLAVADLLIALDCKEHRPYVDGLGREWASRFRFWSVPDLHEWPAAQALEAIEREVQALLQELSAKASA